MKGLSVQLHAIFAACCGAMLALAAAALNLGHGLHATTFACIAGALYIPVWALEVDAEDEGKVDE